MLRISIASASLFRRASGSAFGEEEETTTVVVVVVVVAIVAAVDTGNVDDAEEEGGGSRDAAYFSTRKSCRNTFFGKDARMSARSSEKTSKN